METPVKHHQAAPAKAHPVHAARPPRAKRVPAAPPTTDSTETRDSAIRETAYGFYEARGQESGHELDDWLMAEAEVDRARTGPVESPGPVESVESAESGAPPSSEP